MLMRGVLTFCCDSNSLKVVELLPGAGERATLLVEENFEGKVKVREL